MDSWFYDLTRGVEAALLLALCLLVELLVHECGHYLAARFQGLKVSSVTVGRGRLLWSRTDSTGTLWQWYLWPLRAHVHIADFERNTLDRRKKLFVILAGPLANFLLPFLVFFVFFLAVGKPIIPTIVTSVEIGLPAYEAGLRSGDKIVSIDDRPVSSLEDIEHFTHPRPEKSLKIRYERDGISHETSVMPIWVEYRDVKGVYRAHGRVGFGTDQAGYYLKYIHEVDGRRVKTPEDAYAALAPHMDKPLRIGFKMADGKIHTSEVNIPSSANPHFGDFSIKEGRKVFLGTLRDNLYMQLGVSQSAMLAVDRGAEMLMHVARLPFNLFPIDMEWITPGAMVSERTSYFKARLYAFVFFTSLCSCFLGFMNLVPFPRLDGCEALLLVSEAWIKRPLALKEKTTILVFSLLFLYTAIWGLNVDNISGYYQFQMQKVQAAESDSGADEKN